MSTFWAFDVDGDRPIVTGPYASADEQKQVVREKRARGSRAYWLDVVGGEPHIGRVTVSDGDPTPAPVASLAEPATVAGVSAEERARLRTLAEAATMGPWERLEAEDGEMLPDGTGSRGEMYETDHVIHIEHDADMQYPVADCYNGHDAAYVSAVDPPTVLRVLAALDAAEARAAQAERERDEATQGAEALAARLTEIRSLYEDARAEWRIGGDDAR